MRGGERRGATAGRRGAAAPIRCGEGWVLDMDISKFFDRVNHDILMSRIGVTLPRVAKGGRV